MVISNPTYDLMTCDAFRAVPVWLAMTSVGVHHDFTSHNNHFRLKHNVSQSLVSGPHVGLWLASQTIIAIVRYI